MYILSRVKHHELHFIPLYSYCISEYSSVFTRESWVKWSNKPHENIRWMINIISWVGVDNRAVV